VYHVSSFAAACKQIVPSAISRQLLRIGASLNWENFLRLAHTRAHAPNERISLIDLRERGFYPRFIVDVGAYEGTWTRTVKQIWPHARVRMFEPNAEKSQKLAAVCGELSVEWSNDLLGAIDGEPAEFHVMETGSSVFAENSNVRRKVVSKQLRQLDSAVEGQRVDFLKIDTQGYEVEVLKGATKVLADAEVLLLEMSLLPINKGAPMMHEVVGFLKERGFVLYDIVELRPLIGDGALWQIDGIFVRENSFLRRGKTLVVN
jgi:FkbM family methyltransferase